MSYFEMARQILRSEPVITFVVPPAGEKPSEFRRNFVQAIRDASSELHSKGQIGTELLEEIIRALPLEGSHDD
jgi:hypothetical protein